MDITIVPVGLLGTNCYILQSDKKNCAVIDPGAQPEKIIAMLEREKLEVKYILLTHGHYDHIGGVKKLMARFKEAKLYIGEHDADMLADTEKSFAAMHGGDMDEFLPEGAEIIEDGQETPLDELTIHTVETPGHTKGGMTYLCRDAMFSGDTLFREDCGRCDLPGGDYETIKRSLKKLHDLDGDYIVYPGHGESSTLAHERVHNRYMLEGCE